jgi:uncharacterized repeat protein (TIGR03803 family)
MPNRAADFTGSNLQVGSFVRFYLLWMAAFLILLGQTVDAQISFQTVHSFGPIGTTAPLATASDGALYGTTAGGGTNHNGSVFRITTNGLLNTIYSFTGSYDGCTPYGGLVQAGDGSLYGTTYYGGSSNAGTVFRITTGGVLTTLYQFSGADGRNPRAGLVQAGNGILYGTTYSGGSGNAGTIFGITTGGAFTAIYSFTGGADGGYPFARLMQADDGNLYGTTISGGTAGHGTIFRITSAGSFSNLYSFGNGFDGANPYAALMQASDGYLYGTAESGGYSGVGTIFRISTNGAFGVILSFGSGSGSPGYPYAGLMQASDGNFYGTAALGGTISHGAVFELNTNGAFTQLYAFSGGDGQWPLAELVQAADGNLYGTTQIGGTNGNGTVFQLPLSGTLATIGSLSGIDGEQPESGLMQASDGHLYGTTRYGGSGDFGTVFQIALDGSSTTVHSFNAKDGVSPRQATLVQTSDGALYGTTPVGGPQGYGTVFRVMTNGEMTTLYSFTNFVSGSTSSEAGLVLASDGNLYGTTYSLGSNQLGTVFQIGTNGGFSTVWEFPQTGKRPLGQTATNGANPNGVLMQAGDGNLYGTTSSGGSSNFGTIFRITTSGALTTLHSFVKTDGAGPEAGLIQANDGNLYGTTYGGGQNGGGTVFRITTNGVFTTLHSFIGPEGFAPYAGLIQAADGNLYGTAFFGGKTNLGTIYQISTNGVLKTIHFFIGGDGAHPKAQLVQAGDGNLYGTSSVGGQFGYGSVFRIVLPVIIQSPELTAGNFSFGFQTVTNQSYTVLQAADPVGSNWTVYTNFFGDGSLAQLCIPTNDAPQQFFTVRKP